MGPSPTQFEWMDSILGRLRSAGFSAEMTHHAYHALDSHIVGFTLWVLPYLALAEDQPDLGKRALESAQHAGLAHLAEHIDYHLAEGADGHVRVRLWPGPTTRFARKDLPGAGFLSHRSGATMPPMDGQSERRVITALFIDVVGSTDLMMRLGPEVMRRRLADAFEQMSSRIAEHGGTVENYSGDAVFAIFGAPTAHVDDPQRALRAARACVDWSDEGLAHDRLGVRVGVESGEALVDLAAVSRHERMAIGPCVNIAARLQQQADRGEIVVGSGTQAATAGMADYEDLGSLQLKGLGELNGWRFVGFASEEGATEVPLVGRDKELGLLKETATRATDGTPMLALIVGEPGLGKSRLAAELIGDLDKAGTFRILRARCRPDGEEGANTPLRQLVELDLPRATPDSVRNRLAELLGPDDGEVAATSILHSAGLQASAELQAISRYEQRETIASAWLRYLSALADPRPLLITVEDLHWADPVLVRMLDHVSAEAHAAILVVITARPEFSSSAHLRPAENRIQVDLEALDAGAARALAEAARGSVAGLERAEGNPLFIIELARAKSSAADLPMTIQAAIAARLDETSQEERQLLQRVAVAGETFDVRDAALLADREPAEVAGMLGRLAHLGFVQPVGAAFRFNHALIRDVAYGRLPVSTRLDLHARYADSGVATTDRVARAFHLWEATKPPDAEWAWEDSTRLQALRARAFDAQLEAGKDLEASNQYEQAEEAFRRASELAADGRTRGDALAELGRVMARQGRGDDGWATRKLALQAYADGGVTPPSRLYADMLENVTMNWGYFMSCLPIPRSGACSTRARRAHAPVATTSRWRGYSWSAPPSAATPRD